MLTHWSACNPGGPWWRKREIVTDVLYWFLIPLDARFGRIGLVVMGAALLFNINGADALMKFDDIGFRPLAEMPLWLQAITFLFVSDVLLYLVSPLLSWSCLVEISRGPLLVTGAPLELGGALPSHQYPIWCRAS